MSLSTIDDLQFREALELDTSRFAGILEGTIQWIEANMEVENVFSALEIINWAKANAEGMGYAPEDFFSDEYLDAWLEREGYIKDQSIG